MNGRGRLTQPLDKVRPVMDQQRSRLGHAHGKLVQRVQQGGLFLAVPQNADLVLVKPLIFRKCLRVPGPKLADAVIQKAPPGGGSFPDQIQVLRAEQHALKNTGQLAAVFQLDAVRPQHPPRPPVQLRLQQKLSISGKHIPLQKGVIHAELDQLPVISGPMADAGEIGHRLQQIRLSLGVVTVDHIDIRVKRSV